MSARHFPVVSERQEGRAITTYRLECGKCGCTGNIGNQSLGEKAARDLVAQKFERKGWFVGQRPKDDRCPSCVAAAQSATRDKRKPTLSVVKPVSIEASLAQFQEAASKPAADPPREMTRDERRIIFSKLDEVYLDEKRGYDNGWSDKRVATDLAVPQAWVAKIRDENFGAEKSNEEARELVSDARRLMEDATKVVAEGKKIANEFDAWAEKNENMESRMNELWRRIDRFVKQCG